MARPVELIIVPYDSALRDTRMGCGPLALLRAGLAARLEAQGSSVTVTEIEAEGEFLAEIATAFELHRRVRDAVEHAIAARRRPITVAGNCNTGVVGSLAAHRDRELALFWFDAHSDAETPDSTSSGFLDGTGLAMALGCCWRTLLESLGELSLEGSRTALVGAREISAAAAALLRDNGVAIVSPQEARDGAIGGAIDKLRGGGARRAHVHVDLDVLDRDLVGAANGYALPDGLSEAQLLALLDEIAHGLEVVSASVASYDPAFDSTGRIGAAGLRVVERLAV